MSPSRPTKIQWFGLSDTGKVRQDNQDAIRVLEPDEPELQRHGLLYGVADGMGGYAHGGVASSLALETFFDTYYTANGSSIEQRMKQGIQMANLGVYQTAQRLSVGMMGTTLTTVSLVGHTFHIAHVGDSRAYLLRRHQATLLTNDHTRVGELVRMKILSPEKIRTHAQRSVLDKCLGLNLFVQPDITTIDARADDIIVLCTDGIWSVIEDAEFGQLSRLSSTPEQLTRRIFDLAMDRDTDDNLSVLALQVDHLGPAVKGSERQPLFKRLFQGLKRKRNVPD
jgi:protein phosphatase